MNALLFIVIFLAGAFFGGGLALALFTSRPDGVFHIRHKDEDTDSYSLDFTTGLDDIPNKKIVILKVKKTE